MNNDIDFLNRNTILKYLLIFGMLLIAGSVGKDIVALLIVMTIMFCVIMGKSYRAIEIWLIWFFIYGFYNGQGYIQIEFVSKYLTKPSFILFCIFLTNIRYIKDAINKDKLSIFIILFIIILLTSQMIHGQSPFAAITAISFYLLYYYFKYMKFEKYQYLKMFNLFVAVGLLQLIVSILQLKQIIPPSSTIMEDGNRGTFEWIAGLDDSQCGTFGAVSGHLVSWYESLISLFLLLVWVIVRKQEYLIMSATCLLQFTTTDSKTIMVIMLLMMVYLFFYYFVKHRKKYNLKVRNIISMIFVLSLLSCILLILWNGYYIYYTQNTIESNRGNLNDVYQNYFVQSKDQVLNNILDWGKIQGFRYVFDDFKKEGIVDILFGYGIQGYKYNDKMSLIESKDTPLMQVNNFTNSRSGLIGQFATTGVIGFLLFVYIFIKWYKINIDNLSINNNVVLVNNGLLIVFSLFTFITAFLYSMFIINVPIVSFGGLVGLLGNYAGYSKRK
jgi:hypothetical protein